MKSYCKKVISIVLCLMMILTLSFVPVSAETNDSNGKIVVSSGSAEPGETVDITVSVTENPGIIMLGADIEYDSDVFKLEKIADGGILGIAFHPPVSVVPYHLSWQNPTAMTNLTGTGTAITLTFSVAENASLGEYPIKLIYDNENEDILNFDGDTVDFDVQNGVITVKKECKHSVVTDKAIEASCTEDGKTEGSHCSVCNEVFKAQETVPAKGHTVVTDKAVDPTCTEEGKTEGSHCSVCNEVIKAQETVPAKGHTVVTDKAVEASCTEEGKTEGSHCSVCNEVIKAQETVPAKGHTVVTDKAVEASCTEEGKTEGSHCSVCNEVIKAQETVSAKGHTVVIDKAVEASCTEEGKTEGGHCSVCNEVVKAQETVPAKGHTVVTDKAVEASCTEEGKTEGSHCSVCNEVITAQDTVSAKGHTVVTDKAVEATCTEEGKTEGSHCSVCNEVVKAQETVPAKGHTVVTDKAVEASCTEEGKTEGSHCSVCNEVVKAQETVPAKGHNYQVTYNWVDDGSSCTAEAVCENDDSHVLSETGKIKSEVKEAATCKEMGTTTYIASFENKDLESNTKDVKDIPVDENAHSYNIQYDWADDGSTCTANAVCENDNTHFESEEGVVTSTVKTPATTTSKGVTEYTASFTNSLFEKQTKEIDDIDKIIEEKCPSDSFKDVDKDAWYHEAVDNALVKGYFRGMSNTIFAPSDNITRAQFAQVLANVAGADLTEYTKSSFDDVADGKWYVPAVEWAYKNGIVNGIGDNKFAPEDYITREQLAKMFRSYLAMTGVDVSNTDESELNKFDDSANVSSWAKDSMAWAINAGVIHGNGSGVAPTDNTTRAETCQILMNYFK